MSTVLVFSEDPVVRDQVRLAIGRSPAAGVDVDYVETDAADVAVAAVDRGQVDLLVLDGEAWPAGGLGLSRELKNSRAACPPIVVLIARPDDRWLAAWSQADAVVAHPIDAVELTRTVVGLLAPDAVAPAGPGAESDKETP